MTLELRLSYAPLCLATLMIAGSIGCGWGGTPIVADPVVSPAPGSYTKGVTVRLSESTPGAQIYYTLDGTKPESSSTRYTGPIQVTSNVMVNAVGVAGGYANSSIVAAAYIVPSVTVLPSAATPSFNLPAGTYTSAQQVTISDSTPGASIYYTLDGTTPTTGSALFTGAITLSSTATIKAIAVAAGYSDSAVGSAMYTISVVAQAAGQWTWMSGTDTTNDAGVYGTLGVASAGSVPGSRQANGNWVDKQGNLWIFGGVGVDAAGNLNEMNDLWSYSLAANQWTWVSGSTTVGAFGVYGMLGVASPGSVPGARVAGATWPDKNGRLWLFGGVGSDSTQANGALDDLWMFDPSTLLWTWEGGDDALGESGSYGSLGVPSVNNLPGARASEAKWTDSSGNFWLFGGDGLDAAGNYSTLNDLWEFNPNTKEWTWVSGSSRVNSAGVYGTQGVASASNMPGARSYSTGWADSNGNFWIFGGEIDNAFTLLNDLWMFDPKTGLWTWVAGTSATDTSGSYGTQGQAAAGNTPGSRFAGTGWADSSSNLYFFGGTGYASTGRFNLGAFNDLWVFNTSTELWTWIGGSELPVVPGVYGTQGVSAPGNIPGSRYFVSGWTDKAGNFWLLGGTSEVANGSGLTNDLWRYIP